MIDNGFKGDAITSILEIGECSPQPRSIRQMKAAGVVNRTIQDGFLSSESHSDLADIGVYMDDEIERVCCLASGKASESITMKQVSSDAFLVALIYKLNNTIRIF